MLPESEIDENYLVKATDNEGNLITQRCHLCDNPQGIIFKKNDFPMTNVMPFRTYVCQKCAQNYIDDQKKDEEERGKYFDEIAE